MIYNIFIFMMYERMAERTFSVTPIPRVQKEGEEKYSMVDQMRRSSRSVCANLAEAWRKRRYKAAFIAKLSDAESEACETQVWIEFALRCGYLDQALADKFDHCYDRIIGQIVRMIQEADKWLIK